MDYYNVLLAKKTNRVLQFGSLYERLFETWINRARQILKDLPTGSISTVNDAAPLPLNALKVSVEAIQDLHGYDHPWPAGGGKNKLPLVLADIKTANTSGTWSGDTYTVSGVSFEVQTDDGGNVIGIATNGTAADQIIFDLGKTPTTGEYILNGCPSGGSINDGYSIYVTGIYKYDVGSGVDITLSGTAYDTSILIRANTNVTNKVFYPMIRLSTESDSSFAPYSNISSISGWDSGEITVCDDIQNPTQTETTALDFPATIYGAEWDVTNGPMLVTHDVIDLSTLSWSSTSWGGWRATRPDYILETADTSLYTAEKYKSDTYENISDPNYEGSGIALGRAGTTVRYIYVRSTDGAEPTGMLKYPLVTPTIIDLSPLSIRLRQGTDNLYADCGDILSGKYWANV